MVEKSAVTNNCAPAGSLVPLPGAAEATQRGGAWQSALQACDKSLGWGDIHPPLQEVHKYKSVRAYPQGSFMKQCLGRCVPPAVSGPVQIADETKKLERAGPGGRMREGVFDSDPPPPAEWGCVNRLHAT